MSKVLFIIHDLHQEDNHFPLGPAYLAAVLEKKAHDVHVICQDVTHWSNRSICDYIADSRPDIIGLGFLAARFRDTVLPLCKEINSVKGDGWLVLGGHGASGCPLYVQETTGCDATVKGEGEKAILELIRAKEQEDIPWPQEIINDLDSLPFPAWHLFPIDEYKKQLKMPGWEPGDFTLGVVTSRGCKGKCTFCQRLSKGLRFRSMESVVEEINHLYSRYGINYIFFQDEMFVASKKRMVEFHDELGRKNLLGKIKWGGASRVEVIDTEMLEILKSTNVQFLNYGFESMAANVLKLMEKGTTPTQNYICADLTKKAGIPFNLNVLWGMPGDTVETLKKNITFIEEFDTHRFLRTIRPPTPYPGCTLFDQAVLDGKLEGPADFFDKFTNSDRLTVNFTDLPDEEVYRNLYWANCKLIRNYYDHAATKLSAEFYNLYFGNVLTFRGARHYA